MDSGYLLMLIGVGLAPTARARRLGVLATLAAGLAMAGLRAGPTPASVDLGELAALPGDFVAVAAALLLLAVALGAWSVRAAWPIPVTDATRLLGVGALAAGTIVVGWTGWSLLLVARVRPLLLALPAVAAIGALPWLAGRWSRLRPAAEMPLRRRHRLTQVAALLLIGAAPHVALVFLGASVAAWLGAPARWRLPRTAGVGLLLALAYWLMATIAGPMGLMLSGVESLPFSPAAERLLAPIVLAAGWMVAGLWPLHRSPGGVLAAAAGVGLVARVALVAFPSGIEHWRALAMPVVVLGLWQAALGARWPALAVGFAWIDLLGPAGVDHAGAAALLAGGLGLELLGRREGRPSPGWLVAAAVSAVAVGTGGLLAVEGGLGTEVVYTVLAVAAAVAAAGRSDAVHPMMPSEPSATSASA
jgi:hypothetical protein